MKKHCWFFLLLLIPLGSWRSAVEVQYLNYDIFIGNNKIGEVIASKNIKGVVTTYSVQTNLSFKLLESYDINYQLSSNYKNNLLIESGLKNIVNGNIEDNVHFKWDGKQYIGQVNQDPFVFKDKINQSIAKLYFHEPVGVERVFSEKYANFEKLTSSDPHQYTLHLGDGNKSKYTYRDGVCFEVLSSKSFFKIQIKLRS